MNVLMSSFHISQSFYFGKECVNSCWRPCLVSVLDAGSVFSSWPLSVTRWVRTDAAAVVFCPVRGVITHHRLLLPNGPWSFPILPVHSELICWQSWCSVLGWDSRKWWFRSFWFKLVHLQVRPTLIYSKYLWNYRTRLNGKKRDQKQTLVSLFGNRLLFPLQKVCVVWCFFVVLFFCLGLCHFSWWILFIYLSPRGNLWSHAEVKQILEELCKICMFYSPVTLQCGY